MFHYDCENPKEPEPAGMGTLYLSGVPDTCVTSHTRTTRPSILLLACEGAPPPELTQTRILLLGREGVQIAPVEFRFHFPAIEEEALEADVVKVPLPRLA